MSADPPAAHRAAYYSQIAPSYDALHGAEQDAKLREFLARVELISGMRVLDVGCGTGRSARMLAECRWWGIDPSEGMIAHASPNIRGRIVHGTGERLPFPDAAFDVVLSLTALQNYDDPERGVAELARVCAESGCILLSFIRKSQRADALETLVRRTLRVVDSWENAHDRMFVCRTRVP